MDFILINKVFLRRSAKKFAIWNQLPSSLMTVTSTKWLDRLKVSLNAPNSLSWTLSRKRPPWTDAKSRYLFPSSLMLLNSSVMLFHSAGDMQSTYKRNGKNMIQTEVQENGTAIVYDREVKGDEMHVVRIQLYITDIHKVWPFPWMIPNRKWLTAIWSPIVSSSGCKLWNGQMLDLFRS